MNPNFFPPNPYTDSYMYRAEGIARSPLTGGARNFYRSPGSSPQCRSQMPMRPVVPRSGSGHYSQHTTPYSWTPRSSSPAGSGYVPLASSGSSPRYRSPFDNSTPSTPFPNQNERGSFRQRGSGRFSGGGHQSWSGTPPNMPGSSGGGVKRLSSGSTKYDSCNPGGSSNISLYYNPGMLSDPWAGLRPVSVNQTSVNTPCGR